MVILIERVFNIKLILQYLLNKIVYLYKKIKWIG
jgi:hypothetical protein